MNGWVCLLKDWRTQPRVPAGSSAGGQFTSTGGAGSASGGGGLSPSGGGSATPGGESSSTSESSLRSGSVSSAQNMYSNSVNEVYLVKFEDGTEGVFKAGSDEPLRLRKSIPDRKGYLREAAAYEVAKVVGMDDLVPPTVVREVNGKEGSLQLFCSGVPAMAHRPLGRYDGEVDSKRAAAFDFIMGNTDRHLGNWLVKGDKLRLIDNGLCLPNKPLTKTSYGIGIEYDQITDKGFFGRWTRSAMFPHEIPAEIKAPWRGKWPAIEKALQASNIDPEAITLAHERYTIFMESNTFEGARERLLEPGR